jgi:hypothetical protein
MARTATLQETLYQAEIALPGTGARVVLVVQILQLSVANHVRAGFTAPKATKLLPLALLVNSALLVRLCGRHVQLELFVKRGSPLCCAVKASTALVVQLLKMTAQLGIGAQTTQTTSPPCSTLRMMMMTMKLSVDSLTFRTGCLFCVMPDALMRV